MSLRLIKPLTRNTGFRLNLWYASTFTASAAVLFILVYFLLSVILERKDREVIEAQLKEYAVVYTSSDSAGLRHWIETSQDPIKQKTFYVRLVSPKRSVVLSMVPEEWGGFVPRIQQLDTVRDQVVWSRIPRDEEQDFMLVHMRLFDGSVLQVGRSTNNRDALLKPFRTTFIAVMTPILVLAITGGAFFSHRALRPVRQVVSAADLPSLSGVRRCPTNRRCCWSEIRKIRQPRSRVRYASNAT
jgi:hypothetical protein